MSTAPEPQTRTHDTMGLVMAACWLAMLAGAIGYLMG